jgi:hypothetical protein
MGIEKRVTVLIGGVPVIFIDTNGNGKFDAKDKVIHAGEEKTAMQFIRAMQKVLVPPKFGDSYRMIAKRFRATPPKVFPARGKEPSISALQKNKILSITNDRTAVSLVGRMGDERFAFNVEVAAKYKFREIDRDKVWDVLRPTHQFVRISERPAKGKMREVRWLAIPVGEYLRGLREVQGEMKRITKKVGMTPREVETWQREYQQKFL